MTDYRKVPVLVRGYVLRDEADLGADPDGGDIVYLTGTMYASIAPVSVDLTTGDRPYALEVAVYLPAASIVEVAPTPPDASPDPTDEEKFEAALTDPFEWMHVG